MNAQEIYKELDKTLRRYQAGLITSEQARQEQALLSTMLKAHEQTVLEEKLALIEAVLEARQ